MTATTMDMMTTGTIPSNGPALRMRGVGLRLGPAAPRFELEELDLAAGGRMAVLGPSGCGKSTLLSLAGGVLRADAGRIEVRGTDLQSLRPAALDRFRGATIGFVFQTFNLLEAFSAEENVRLGMAFGGKVLPSERVARARELLDKVGVAHRASARPHRLSIGERQRVAIARAVAARPALLLADEPTGSLDPVTARRVHELILSVCAAEKCALLYVTHDHALAADFPHRFDASGLLRRGGAEAA